MSDNNTSPFPPQPIREMPPVSPMQKLGNAVNMFGMAVANEDEKVIASTKKHLIDIIHTIHPEKHPVVSPIVQAK